MKGIKLICLFLLLINNPGLAKDDPYARYIDTYAGIAMEQQEAYGIPASITLAQGLLESRAGQSSLASVGNNHFGIKCHKEWTGDTLLRNDDAANECFRAYADARESFEDHSKFLKRRRYAPLFEYEVTDYASWARGLKACGYATDPNYAIRLITIIERYGLQEYDRGGVVDASEGAGFIHSMLSSMHAVRRSRGLHCVFASPGDTYASIAGELGMDAGKLMAYNDVEEDGEIKPWEEVYLEPKRDSAPMGIKFVTIGEGESMHSISQRFGIKLEVIKKLNSDILDRPGNKICLN